ncbi:FHA domain-containing protein [Actinomadura rayongensis]|uniref:FHA domain-containing protein n=1 Tax=Actinomadura rayongensis TaxID=1429076 RepID=A0A6I4WB93_9ACTN|nr:FHA domain-containing protein [Actinomadura rayongensis]MXQ66938.1 FHA domain-containing protein [Actinomadura rayongensis]
MTARCPNGHASASEDYCDVCGEPIACPFCNAPRTGGRFCEDCGYGFASGDRPEPLARPEPTSAPSGNSGAASRRPGRGWTATISPDPTYFATVQAQDGPDTPSLRFPADDHPRTVPLLGDKVRIGRRSVARGLLPEIDLSLPPADPGVSHAHAVLVASPDAWTIIDTGSTNGTTINGGLDPIPANAPVPVGDGDRIHVGAWTTITLAFDPGAHP